MRELFIRSFTVILRSAFSVIGLAVGAGLEDLGKGLRSQVGTMYNKGKGSLWDGEAGSRSRQNSEIIGYQFVFSWKNDRFIKKR